MKFLADPRYLRVNGRPVLAVYRISQIPDYQQVIDALASTSPRARAWASCSCSASTSPVEFDGLIGGPKAAGLDGLLGFPPHNLKWEWVSHGGLKVDKTV